MNEIDKLKSRIEELETENEKLKEHIQYVKDFLKNIYNPIIVKENGRLNLIPHNGIIAIVSDKQYFDLYINEDYLHKISKDYRTGKVVTLRRTLDDIKKMLNGINFFIKISRSVIINCQYLVEIKENGFLRLKGLPEEIEIKLTNDKRKKLFSIIKKDDVKKITELQNLLMKLWGLNN